MMSRKESNHKYYITHREACLKRCTEWAKRNRKKRVQIQTKYRLKHLSYYNFISQSYKYAVKLRTPKWANLEKIKQIYLSCPKNKVVDHIIPLQGKIVSGLHVHNNLQYLTPKQNNRKNNRY